MQNKNHSPSKASVGRRLLQDRRGAGYVEYMVITAVVGVVVLGAYSANSDQIGATLVEKSLKLLGVQSNSSSGNSTGDAAERAAAWEDTVERRREAAEIQEKRAPKRHELGETERAKAAERRLQPETPYRGVTVGAPSAPSAPDDPPAGRR